MSDNNNLKKLNKLLVTINKINLQLLKADDEKKLCQQICRYLVQIKNYKFVWLGLKESSMDEITPVAIAGKEKEFVRNIKNSWNKYRFNGCPTSMALKSGRHFINEDLKNVERFVPWDKKAIEEGFLSVAVLPIKYHDEVIGTLHIYSDIKNYFIKEEIKFLNEVAGDVSIVIKNLRNEKVIAENKKGYEELFKSISSCVAIYEATGNGNDFIFKDFNKAAEKAEKIKRKDIIGKSVLEVFPGVKDFGLFDVFKRVYKTGKSENQPISIYRDSRISGWRENFVYKLPNGNIVAAYNDLTNQKKAEEALQKRENLLSKIFDILPVGLWIADKNGKLIRSNQMGREIWGAEPLIGQDQYSVFKARRLPSLEEIAPNDWALAHSINSGETILDEMLEIDAFDGKKKIILNYTSPVLGEDGKVEAGIIVNLDITKQMIIQDALVESEENLRRAQHLSKIGSWKWIVATDTVQWSEGLYQIYRHDSKLPVPSFAEMSSFFTPKSRERLNEAVAKAISNGEPYEIELDLIQTNGIIINTSVRGEVHYDASGKIEYMHGTVQDITERKKATEEIKNTQLLLKSGIESPKDMIILAIDKDYNYLFFNGVHKDAMMHAYGKEVEVGMNLLDCITSEIDKVNSRINYGRALNGESHSTIQEYGDKKRSFYETFYNPIINENNEIIGTTAFARDITERKNAENEIIYISFHDKLTGLYNRRFFEEEILRLNTKRQMPLSVVMIDLNSLKLINDTFGHNEGDKILKETAALLKKICRSDDILARWGGDEFVILLPKTSITDSEEIVQRIKKECSKLTIQKIPLSLAIGVATKTEAKQDMQSILIDAENNMYKNKLIEKESSASSIISALEQALYEKSNETMEHAFRLKDSAIKLGKSIKLASNQLDELSLLASLHDIGKVSIPEKILLKEGKLTEKEWEVIKRHPEIGFNIAQSSPQIVHIAKFILACHENWDGSGYPQGLTGESIPIVSRIMLICDAYDVMTSKRLYKKTMSKEASLKELKRCSGTQFDPVLVDKFIEILSN